MFKYTRLMQFYETDGMGIIHHANYVLSMEEARLQFLRLVNEGVQDPLGEVNFPLLSCHVDYKKPLHFNDEVTIEYTVEAQAARLIFDYTFYAKRIDKPAAFGKTVHAAFDMKEKRAIRMPKNVVDFLNQRGKNG
ncbi:MAG: acyl-CoA thioesterase [Bdellovibrionales bacterium]|nr:acyl-CoA thioesterase [Bdellovibrionales bacterium]NQZ20056.1 acyl-CoA thioesterase [Bdellovibrionales bacterium]